MKTVSLDVHAEASQLVVVSADGEVLLEMKVPTTVEDLRRVVGAISGPKQVVFEEGPLSAMLYDALSPLAEKVVSCDPTRNALIGRAEDSNDERDARRLAELAQTRSIRAVYVPEAPLRALRGLLGHEGCLCADMTAVKNRIKALARRHGVACRGASAYRAAGRREVLARMGDAAARWQMESLGRQLDMLRGERAATHRVIERTARPYAALLRRLETVPGVGPASARTLVAWLCDPRRFKSRQALNSYAGLGLGQGYTNWKPVGRSRASKRGNREVKRMLFIAAQAAVRGENALARRHAARLASGWDRSKAIRDAARTILWIVERLWNHGGRYDDSRVSVPGATPAARRPVGGRLTQRRKARR